MAELPTKLHRVEAQFLCKLCIIDAAIQDCSRAKLTTFAWRYMEVQRIRGRVVLIVLDSFTCVVLLLVRFCTLKQFTMHIAIEV